MENNESTTMPRFLVSAPVLGGEVMSQRVSKLFLGGHQPLKAKSEVYITYTTIFKN